MQVINYDNIIDIPISEVQDNQTWWKVTPWVYGVDNEMINGSTAIYNMPEWGGWATSIAGWTTNVTWGNPTNKKITRSAWYIYLPDWSALPVTAWNVDNMSAVTYIYYDMTNATVNTTTVPQDAVWADKLLLCVAKPVSATNKKAEYQAFGTDAQSQFITADSIAANTITANEIASNTITANQISASDISANNLIWNTIEWKTIQGCTIRAYNWSGSSLDEIKMWTQWTQPRIQFTDNGTVVWSMAWITTTVWWNSVDALVIWWSSTNYLWLSWRVFCSNYFKLPVGSNLYF